MRYRVWLPIPGKERMILPDIEMIGPYRKLKSSVRRCFKIYDRKGETNA